MDSNDKRTIKKKITKDIKESLLVNTIILTISMVLCVFTGQIELGKADLLPMLLT